jgi:hypothetical protein
VGSVVWTFLGLLRSFLTFLHGWVVLVGRLEVVATDATGSGVRLVAAAGLRVVQGVSLAVGVDESRPAYVCTDCRGRLSCWLFVMGPVPGSVVWPMGPLLPP